MSDEPGAKSKRATLFRFSVATDIALLKAVINVAPYDAPFGQTTGRWEEVTEYMREIHGENVTFTGCRKRFDDLMAAFKKDTIKAMRASGTEEQISERAMLLEDISDLTEAAVDKKKAAKEDKVKKVDKRENDGIRAAALQGLKRRTADGDDQESDHDDNAETPSKKTKRAAAATSDVASIVQAISSMIEATNKLKQDELAAKQEKIAAKKEAVAVRKEELALSHRKLQLEEQRYLLDKSEREARFQLEKTEREAQLEFMRSTIEMMRSMTSNK